MSNLYGTQALLEGKVWNNAFAWDERYTHYGRSPNLTIPSLIDGDIEDIALWDDIVFEEIEHGKMRSCRWLKHFVKIIRQWDTVGMTGKKEIIIFDNHNHALYFWIDAARRWIITPWCELIHIDEHSDLWENSNTLDRDKAINNEAYAWDFTNKSCNVGNYIEPALRCGLISDMIRIENEFQIDSYLSYLHLIRFR